MYTALIVAFAGASLITAAPINFTKRYRHSKYEPYDEYHLRYVALDCRTKHNTTFFVDCCHPLRNGENITEVRSAYCVPNATAIASASAHIAGATAPLPSSSGNWNTNDAGNSNSSDDTASNNSDDGAAAAYTSLGGDAPTSTTSAYDAPTSTTSAYDAPTDTPPSAPSPSPSIAVENHVAQDSNQNQDASSEQGPSSSSSDQAPTSSSSSDQAPSPTSSSDNAQPTPSGDNNNDNNNGGGGGGDVQTGGQATFYSQTDGGGGPAGACGAVHSDSDIIVALSTHGPWYPNANAVSPYCGRKVQIWPAGDFAGKGNTITATCADACPSCTHSGNDIDLSLGAWAAMGIADSVGVVPIEWKFV